jgi:hypothetical protein
MDRFVGCPAAVAVFRGRLVAPDQGAHPYREKDDIARDVDPAGCASSAEEAAMHIKEE